MFTKIRIWNGERLRTQPKVAMTIHLTGFFHIVKSKRQMRSPKDYGSWNWTRQSMESNIFFQKSDMNIESFELPGNCVNYIWNTALKYTFWFIMVTRYSVHVLSIYFPITCTIRRNYIERNMNSRYFQVFIPIGAIILVDGLFYKQ